MDSLETIHNTVLSALRVQFKPRQDTLVAIATLLAFWPIYYVNATTDSIGTGLLFLLVGNLFLNVLLPVYYVVVVRNEALSNVGITTTGWTRALGLSVLLTVVFVWDLVSTAEGIPTSKLIPHVIAMGLVFWEPFFVHGWLQIRYERAFGPVPAIVLTGASFGLYHLGTYPLEGVLFLAGAGIFFAFVFRIVYRNLLVLWPLSWAVAASIGTLDGGFLFDWEFVFWWGMILVVTAIGLYGITQTQPDD